MSNTLILTLIILIGFFLRVININNNPPSLYGDELTIVYDAYSILKTGQDQTGTSFPLTFSMGAGRPAGYVYGSIPFVALFGPTALGVRALSILSGIGIIILLYYIGRKFWGKLGLAAAFIVAISPWDISLSRGGFEAHFALFLSLLGLVLFIFSDKKPWFLILSALSFGLTLHTYPTYKLTLPLFLILLIWYKGGLKRFSKEIRIQTILSIVILTVMGILAAIQTFTGGSETRFSNINVFSQKQAQEAIIQKINFERSISILPSSISQYFHNKGVEYGKVLIENYLQNFSLNFLVLHGDGNPRHNMATMGIVYFTEIILLLLGVVSLWQKGKRILALLIGWVLIGALGSTFLGSPHVLRSAFMLPPLTLLSANGLNYFISLSKNIFMTTVTILLLCILIIQFTFFVYKLYFLAPNEYSNFWSYPAKLASEIALRNKENFNYIILSDKIDNIEFAYPVYAKVEPNKVIQQNRQKTALGIYEFKKFDKVHIGFIPDSEIEDFIGNLDGSVLFIGLIEQSKSLMDFETLDALDKSHALVLKKKR